LWRGSEPLSFYASRRKLMHMNYRGVVFALLSAVLFGASTPAAKALLSSVDPGVLAGLLYCGAGVGAGLLRRATRALPASSGAQAPLSRRDWPWLLGAIVLGGMVGPLLLMLGLSRTDASTASLLLTLEGVATALLAWFVFHENFDRRILAGMICIITGTLVLSWSGTPTVAGMLGPLMIIGACVAWGLDNNFTRKVSLADPLQIVELKGLIAGPANLLLGIWSGGAMPSLSPLLIAGFVGFLGYGVSIALFVLALRHLGTARTGAYFSTAPFLGAIVAVIFLHEPVTAQVIAASVLMAIGVWLHLTEVHEHEHEHAPLEHAHSHVHDAHHQHEHGPLDPLGEPHVHWHRHVRLRHKHAHVPDMHHTHRH
jgi:drug/metabolite transporter (DMT)-like permease